MVASSPGPSAASPPNFRSWPGWSLAGLALTVFFYSPLVSAMDSSLDLSNYASYAYFTSHHFQYGRDVVPMYGPLGFILPATAYAGELYWPRLVGQLVAGAGLAALVLWFFHRARASSLRWLWLALFLLLTPYLEDLRFELALLLGGLFLLEGVTTLGVVAVATLLAFISLIKGTHLVLCGGTVFLVLAFHASQRRWGRALLIATAFGAAWLLGWLAAGQAVANVPAFLRGVVALVSGYNDAMTLDETRGVLLRGLLALAMLTGGLGWGLWRGWRQPAVRAAACLVAAFTFALWKHAFVRADGHVVIFHHFAALAAVLWFLYTAADPVRPRGAALRWLFAGVASALWIKVPVLGDDYLHRLVWEWTPQHVRASAAQLLHPARAKAALDAEFARQREKFALPLLREEVGAQPVDFFGLQHGLLLLNGLNYHPRPMGGGSFNAYNSYLMALNRDFIRDAHRRPPYYALRLETIDGRFAAQDDGLALLEIARQYRPLLLEEGSLLLQAAAAPAATPPVPLAQQTFRFGEVVTVPAVPADRLLLARFVIEPSLAGRVRRFLYKLPAVTIRLQTDGGTSSRESEDAASRELSPPDRTKMSDRQRAAARRLIPGMADSPFLFSPLVDDTAGFLRLFSAEPGTVVREFLLETTDASAYAGQLRVEFSTVPRPAAARAPDVGELLAEIPDGLFTVPPASITGPETRALQVGKLRVQQLHAPGRIAWRLDGSERELVFSHGLLPDTFVPGRGNGVDFIVELQAPGAEPQVLFQRLVDPSGHPDERRTLTARVPLPPHLAGSELVLRTDPGPHGDNSWDWSYVTRVQLRKTGGRPVFDRAPLALAGPRPAVVELDGGPAVLLHVPSDLTLGLRPGEHRLHLEFGFLPGAYTGEGRTAGADFVVEWQPAGRAPQEIFRRTLQPVANAADRGPQAATLDLPALAAGDRLILHTRPVAGGSNSWGWTYFSRCDIE